MGVAIEDCDLDGWPDLYLVQGSGREGSEVPTNKLYLNDRDGSFSAGSAKSGTDDTGAGMGALFFDHDDDGDLDLLVTTVADRPRLLRNEGGNRNH